MIFTGRSQSETAKAIGTCRTFAWYASTLLRRPLRGAGREDDGENPHNAGLRNRRSTPLRQVCSETFSGTALQDYTLIASLNPDQLYTRPPGLRLW
jgi:hypothetical protein